MLEIGSVVDGKYKVLNQIGHGGMSTVYLAMNERANKQWAIKEVRKEGVKDFEIVKQSLIVEIEMLKKMSHPYLPSIVDVIDQEDSFLIVMDYIEGNTLLQLLKEYGPQPQEYIVEWGKQLCEVLGYLHSREPAIIYRDLKPANIMLKPNGTITLIDFGTAREYKTDNIEDTTCLGTYGYAAPEQFGGMGQTDARTDIYCLGMTLYHLLTGHNPCEPPYELKEIREVRPDVSEGIEQIIRKCTQKNPKERYQSCEELLYELEHYGELEQHHRRSQILKLFVFLCSLFITVGLVIGAGINKYKANSFSATNYNVMLVEAENQVEDESRQSTYEAAILLNPGEVSAYLDLLQKIYLSDDVLSVEEDEELRRILITNTENGTCEEVLKKNKAGYAELAYQLGIAYFYCYEDTGNRVLAIKWFEAALNSGLLSPQQEERASRLSKIAEYYAMIGKTSKSGDVSVSYSDYWKDLVEVTDGDIIASDNVTTAMIIYCEACTQIYSHAQQFKNAGISEEEMTVLLEGIKQSLEADIKIAIEPDSERNLKLYEQTTEAINFAYMAIQNAYGQE
ncbi:MAG: serine/threonine-protein kinase [Bacillota bacterium]|nr:serine/threonine-protein kinase [Bacillota bacterium]